MPVCGLTRIQTAGPKETYGKEDYVGIDTSASNTRDEISLTPKQVRAFEEADIELCGGMFSGDVGSFRGKVYQIILYEVTGVNLAEEWLPPETVKNMHTALEQCDPEQVIADYGGRNRIPSEILDLRKFFRVCAEQGLGLINW
jgi:hypothetical protein